jgi:integrase
MGGSRSRVTARNTPQVADLKGRILQPISDLVYLQGFCDYQARRNFSAATVRSRQAVLSAFCGWLHPRSVLSARPDDVEGWLASRSLGAQGRYTYLAHLHAFYRWAGRRGLATADPTAGIDRPKLPKRLPRPISPAELEAALDAAGPMMRAVLYLGAYAGLRRAEIAHLERADVLDHLDPPMLVVRNGKGAKDRTVPVHPALLAALQAHGMRRPGPLFRTSTGRPITPGYLGERVSDFMRRAGIERTCHSTRHHFGTAVYAACRDLLMTRDLMGHANASSSEGYVALDAGPAADVVARIGKGGSR